MVNLNIDGKEVSIPPLSKMSFADYNKIIVRGQCHDIEGYISIYTDIPLADLRRRGIGSPDSLAGIHRRLYDLDPEKAVSSGKYTLAYKDRLIDLGDLRFDYFYQGCFYDLFLQKMERAEMTPDEFCVRCLATALAPEGSADMVVIDGIYEDLSKLLWKDVLPFAFFLPRLSGRSKRSMPRPFKLCILGSRIIRAKTLLYRRGLKRQERRRSLSNFANFFALPFRGFCLWISRWRAAI